MDDQAPPNPRAHRGNATASTEVVGPEEGVLVNQGVPDHPWQLGRGATPEPQVHRSAVVQNTRMWPWTWIGPDSTVMAKPVEIGDLSDGLRVIRSGLTPNDQVIIDGIPHAAPGVKVAPQDGTIRYAAGGGQG